MQSQKKSFSQVFLHDEDIVQQIVAPLKKERIKAVLEIGPGNGALTKTLINNNYHVYAIEIDQHWFSVLQKRFKNKRLLIYNADALRVDLNLFLKNNVLEAKASLVSNIPYHITGPLLMKIMKVSKNPKLARVILMVQKEVGLRLLAVPKTKNYNSLTIMSNFYYDLEKVCEVKKTAFQPVPQVDSMVITFKPSLKYKIADEANFLAFVRKMFLHKRKTLFNNLKLIYKGAKIRKKILEQTKITLQQRAEEISLQDFYYLYQNIKAYEN